MFWSAVTTTSKCPAARRSNSPLLRLVHDRSVTVRTSCPLNLPASGRGKDSSSSTRTGGQEFRGNIESGDGLLASHRWEMLQKSLDRVASRQVVQKILDGHAGPGEDRRSTHDFGIAPHDGFESWHPALPHCSS